MNQTSIPDSVRTALVEAVTRVATAAVDAALESSPAPATEPKPAPASPSVEGPAPRWNVKLESVPLYAEGERRAIGTRHWIVVDVPADASEAEVAMALVMTQANVRSAFYSGRDSLEHAGHSSAIRRTVTAANGSTR